MVICFGTRPEWLKVKSVYEQVPGCKLLFTGQHEHLVEGVSPDFSMSIENKGKRLDSIVSSCLENFPDFSDDLVMVQGDTASAFGCALAAFHRGKKLIYLESGLRSFDMKNPFPEEGYRQMISRISDINLCPTDLSKKNLISEGCIGECHVTGNTILDLLSSQEPYYGDHVLVTMHRRENLSIMEDWFEEIDALSEKTGLRFVFPCHPSVREMAEKMRSVDVIDPVSHEDMIDLIKSCRIIITDSGGLQEEGSFFNKKVVVCRKTTERPEGIESGHVVLCTSPEMLKFVAIECLLDYSISSDCPFGDGRASEKIKLIIDDYRNTQLLQKAKPDKRADRSN